MNESEKIDPRELSPLALAFVGDSVLELLVRQRLVEHHRLSAGRLNAEKVKYVSARAQFREEQLLEPLFTEEELAAWSTPMLYWSVDTCDWECRDVQKVFAAICQARDGDVILLHDCYGTSVEAALQAIDCLSEQGVEFVTVEELFALRGQTAEGGIPYDDPTVNVQWPDCGCEHKTSAKDKLHEPFAAQKFEYFEKW